VRPASACGIIVDAIDRAQDEHVGNGFLRPKSDGFNLRWFSPLVEVDLCGHGTLAAAHVLREQGYFTGQSTAHFRTRSGLLTAGLQDE
jgi:predicted PhzF superfamily epimerase YddE/YHI9